MLFRKPRTVLRRALSHRERPKLAIGNNAPPLLVDTTDLANSAEILPMRVEATAGILGWRTGPKEPGELVKRNEDDDRPPGLAFRKSSSRRRNLVRCEENKKRAGGFCPSRSSCARVGSLGTKYLIRGTGFAANRPYVRGNVGQHVFGREPSSCGMLPSLRELPGPVGVSQESIESAPQGPRIAGGDEQTIFLILYDLARSSRRCCHDGRSCQHPFHDHSTEGLGGG